MECTNVKEIRSYYRTDSGKSCSTWHAIYLTAGLDYCREDAPGCVESVEDAKMWAVELFAATADRAACRAVDSYRLERW